MPGLSQLKDGQFIFCVGIWYSYCEGQLKVKCASNKKMIISDSSENDPQIILTIGFFEALKDSLKIHSA